MPPRRICAGCTPSLRARHGFALAGDRLRVAVDGAFARLGRRAARRQRDRLHSAGVRGLRCRASDSPTRRSTSPRCARELLDDRVGAYASFEGWVRDHNDGRAVHGLTYEAIAALAESEGEAHPRRGAGALRHPRRRTACIASGELAIGRAGGLGRRQRRASRCRFRRLPLHHRRSEITRSDLETRALRRRSGWLHRLAWTAMPSEPRRATADERA